MRLSIFLVSLFFVSSVAFSESCSEKELERFEEFLIDMQAKAERIADAAEKGSCTEMKFREMILKIEEMQTDESYKAEVCERAVDFCKDKEAEEKEKVLEEVIIPGCPTNLEFTINCEECRKYFDILK